MTTLKYNPFADLENAGNNGMRLFQDTVSRFLTEAGSARPWLPAVDILETANDLVLKADVPGLALSEIDIRLENGTLTLKGERKFEGDRQQDGYHRVERSYGSFARSFTLPDSIDAEKVAADYKDGVLTITLPKKELAKPRTIKIAVNNN